MSFLLPGNRFITRIGSSTIIGKRCLVNKIEYGLCPCDSHNRYLSCCEPFITEKQRPETPEALMRSRYTAYTMANIEYIKETMRGKALIGFQDRDAMRWAKRVQWIKLTVLTSVIENAHRLCDI